MKLSIIATSRRFSRKCPFDDPGTGDGRTRKILALTSVLILDF